MIITITYSISWLIVLVPCSCKLITKKLAVLLFSISYSSTALQVRSKRLGDNCRVALVAPHTSEVLHFHGRVCLLRCKGHASKVSINHSAISQINKYSSEHSPIQSALNQKRLEARFAAAPGLDEFCHIKGDERRIKMERSRLAVVKHASDTSEGDSLRPICDSPQECQAWESMQQLHATTTIIR